MTGGKLLLTLGLAALAVSTAGAQSIFKDSSSEESEFASKIFNSGETTETNLFSWFFDSPFTATVASAEVVTVTQAAEPVAEMKIVGFEADAKKPAVAGPNFDPPAPVPAPPQVNEPSNPGWDAPPTLVPIADPTPTPTPVPRTPVYVPTGPTPTVVFSNE